VRLYVDDGPAALPEILRMLEGSHITVRKITLSEPTLDDVFLARTGRSLRDPGDTSSEPTSREETAA
jgi:ABC-2 type transport system ATP-binding protein